MGCDILMHSQVKAKDGLWDWYDQDIFNERSYTLFGILDGTRSSEFNPIIEKYKGFPEDSRDKLTVPGPWDYDYVTESGVYLGYAGVNYLTLKELKSFDWDQKTKNGWNLRDMTFCEEVLPYLEAIAQKLGSEESVRIVWGYTV